MGEIERNSLEFWTRKILNDPELLAEDPRGNKVGSATFLLKPGESLRTFCNAAVQRICRGLEYDKLDGMTADEMHDYLEKNWIIPYGSTADKMQAAQSAALLGDIAILSWRHVPHGHVAVVYPDKLKTFSGKWGLYVPKVANVGHKNDVMPANFAFTELPDVFVLGRVVS